MLQTIREHTQGWIAGIIISIIILSFALWGIHSYFEGGTNNTVVAEVNGVDVTKEQLSLSYERLRRQTQSQLGSSAATKDEASLKNRALKSLIDLEVLQQASTAQGYLIANQQVDSYLESMPEFQVDGQFSLDKFQEIMSSTMLSTSEFLDIIKSNLLIGQPKLGIIFTSFAMPDETNYTISLVNQERNIEFVNIPMQYFLSQPIVISADKIKAYYDQHQSDFMTPEQVNVEYVQLSLKDLLVKFSPTDAMLKNFYNENINSYTQSTAWKLAGILIPVSATTTLENIKKAQADADAAIAAINKGESFDKVAKTYTPKTFSEKGFLTLNQVPAELQKAVAGLTKPNQISEPIKTREGLVILKVVEFNEPKIQAFETVKDKVKETYVRQHAEEKFAEARDQLANLTYEHPDSLQLAARTLGVPVLTSELFAKDKSGKDISQYKKVRDTAFSNDVLNLQNNSDVIQLNPETLIVLRVKSHIASTLLPLSGISKQIEDKLKAKESETRAAKFAEDFRHELTTGADPKALANSHKLVWNSTGYIGRYSTKVDSAVLDQAFRLPNPVNANTKVVYGVTRIPNGYAIVALKSVKDGVVADKKQFLVFAEQVQNSEGLLEYELYKASVTNKSKINIVKQ